MSLILKFETTREHEQFLDLVRRDKPELLQNLAPNPLFPHLYARTDASGDLWVQDRIAPFGQAFEDVKFQSFAS